MSDRFLFQEGMESVVGQLCEPASYDCVYHRTTHHDVQMPSGEVLSEAIELLRAVLFPGYFRNEEVRPETMKYHIGATLDRALTLFTEQIKRGYCFACSSEAKSCLRCDIQAEEISRQFISRIPHIREMTASDAVSAYRGDPAAESVGEAIFCYPSVLALTNHRIAHELYLLKVPIIPRMISEAAHSRTGIDIHPGARIGKHCFIDHGTGTVVGETTIIGEGVRIYQGVTLGAKSFPLDEAGHPVKGIPRHPIVEDEVIIYAGATLLGRITIGRGTEIGGNVWLTRSVAPGSRILQSAFEDKTFHMGGGI